MKRWLLVALLLVLPLAAGGDVTYKRGVASVAGVSGVVGNMATEATMSYWDDPEYTLTPQKALKKIYVSCNPKIEGSNDADCDNAGDGVEQVVYCGTTDSATATTIVDASLTGSGVNAATDWLVMATGPAALQKLDITVFTDGTGTVTVADFIGDDPTPGGADEYCVYTPTVAGGDLPFGHDKFPGTREFPIATATAVDLLSDCGVEFVWDSKDQWTTATMGSGLALIAPACGAGWTEDLGIFHRATTIGDPAVWDMTTATASGTPNGCLFVSEATATAWVGAQDIECTGIDEEGVNVTSDGRFFGNRVHVPNGRNVARTTNHSMISQNTAQMGCINCTGWNTSGAGTAGTPLTVLGASKAFIYGGYFRRNAVTFTGHTSAIVDCADASFVGTTIGAVLGAAASGGDNNNGITVLSENDEPECNGIKSDINGYFARLMMPDGSIDGTSAAFFTQPGAASGVNMTTRVRVYQSTAVNYANVFRIGGVGAQNGKFIDYFARGVVGDEISQSWLSISAQGTGNWIWSDTGTAIDFQNSAYDDDDGGFWGWEITTFAPHATRELLEASGEIPAHWTLPGDDAIGDSTSVDLGGDGVDEVSWDADNVAGNADDRPDYSCDPSADCHLAMVSDYTIPIFITDGLPRFTTNGEARPTYIYFEAAGQDMGNP